MAHCQESARVLSPRVTSSSLAATCTPMCGWWSLWSHECTSCRDSTADDGPKQTMIPSAWSVRRRTPDSRGRDPQRRNHLPRGLNGRGSAISGGRQFRDIADRCGYPNGGGAHPAGVRTASTMSASATHLDRRFLAQPSGSRAITAIQRSGDASGAQQVCPPTVIGLNAYRWYMATAYGFCWLPRILRRYRQIR